METLLQTLPGKGLNLGLIEHKSAIREEFWCPLYQAKKAPFLENTVFQTKNQQCVTKIGHFLADFGKVFF